jgi:transposase-like protein
MREKKNLDAPSTYVHRGRGVPWPEETKRKAMERAKVVGAVQAARETHIPEVTLRHWLKGEVSSPELRPSRAQYDENLRHAAIDLAKRHGARQASKETGIPYQTLVRWVRLPEKRQARSVFTSDFRERAVALAVQTSCREAAEKLGMSKSTLGQWILQSKPKEARRSQAHYTSEHIAMAVDLVDRVGVIAAANELDVAESTVRGWWQIAKGHQTRSRPPRTTYSDELKQSALDLLQREGLAQASKHFGIARSLLRKWARREGVRPPRVVGQHSAWDTAMRWLTQLNPDLEDWRCLSEEWLVSQTEALGVRLTSLTAFFRKYLVGQQLTVRPEELLSRFYQAPPAESAFPDTRHGKVCRNYSSEFLDWVLLTKFSETDDHGHILADPLFRNPLGRASFVGDYFDKESRFSALPYSFLVQCRQIVAQGPDFKDWVWAQAQLGVETGSQGGVAPEWFEVPESLIDKNDPDCVWRRRMRSQAAGGPRFEVWSPVRWVAQLVKCILPLRTLQVRVLDSGEADTWQYDLVDGVGTWVFNTSSLRSGTRAKPVERGVFRRPSNDLRDLDTSPPERWANAVLYVNTNKTADSKKSGARKGYVLPWVVEGGLENDVFYWLYKLRKWQAKYNPLERPTSWRELDGRHIPRKSDVQLAGFPDACFLFRLPEQRDGKSYLPLADGMLDHTWHAVLQELEQRLQLSGKTNLDGSPIQLVYPDSKSSKRTMFPPHSVRVSLVTALADAGVPLSILMRLLGHSRLVMTVYYNKTGQAETARNLQGAFDNLRGKGAALLTEWLKNTEHQQLLSRVIGNDDAALLGAIPKNMTARNPSGWMAMSLGMCVVGGNAYPMEGGGTSPGGCFNGGPNLGSDKRPKFSPVPGGARNCVRCRWLVSAPHYLPALVDFCNVQMYHFEDARVSALAADRTYQDLVARQIEAEQAGTSTYTPAEVESARLRFESCLQRFSDRAEDVVATMRLIERCREALAKGSAATKASNSLLAVGDCRDVEVALNSVSSELEHLDRVCESVEIYPELEAPTAVLRRAQLVDAALALEGMSPVFFVLTKEDQLRVGNELLLRLANSAEPNNPSLGRRKVIEIMDARECLSKHLKLNVKALVSEVQRLPIVRKLLIT